MVWGCVSHNQHEVAGFFASYSYPHCARIRKSNPPSASLLVDAGRVMVPRIQFDLALYQADTAS